MRSQISLQTEYWIDIVRVSSKCPFWGGSFDGWVDFNVISIRFKCICEYHLQNLDIQRMSGNNGCTKAPNAPKLISNCMFRCKFLCIVHSDWSWNNLGAYLIVIQCRMGVKKSGVFARSLISNIYQMLDENRMAHNNKINNNSNQERTRTNWNMYRIKLVNTNDKWIKQINNIWRMQSLVVFRRLPEKYR